MTAENWIVIILIGFVGWGGLIIWRLLAARRHADEIYASKAVDDFDMQKLGKEGFRAAYIRARGPRPAIYAFVASVVAIGLLPLFYGVAAWIWNFIWLRSGRPGDLEQGLIPWTFYMIVMMMGGWVSVAALFARLYHWNRPKSLEDEVRKELESTP